jgi:hypothetical protein
MPPHPFDGFFSNEKEKSPRSNIASNSLQNKSKSLYENNLSHFTSSPRTETIDALQFDGPIFPDEGSQFGCAFDNLYLPAEDDSEESALSRRVTDDKPRENEQSISGVQEYDGIQFQGGESPLHCDDGFLTPDISARETEDVILDPGQVVASSSTVNYDILEALEAFRTAGDIAPADYQDAAIGSTAPAGYHGATIGDTAAAASALTNVGSNYIQLSTNESPNNLSHACNYMQQPFISSGFSIAAQQHTSDQTSVNTSLMQQQYMQPQQQASRISWNCNKSLKSDQWNDLSLPLVEWIEMEKMRALQDPKASVLRKLSVAYGIGKLLQSSKPAQESCSVENLIVRESSHQCTNTYNNNTGWEVVGIFMINPPVAVQLVSTTSGNVSAVSSTPASDSFSDAYNDSLMGRDVSAVIDAPFPHRQTGFESVETQLCCALGELLHFLFSGERVQQNELGEDTDTEDVDAIQLAKKQPRDVSFLQASINSRDDDPFCQRELRASHKFRPLTDYGYPASISQVGYIREDAYGMTMFVTN